MTVKKKPIGVAKRAPLRDGVHPTFAKVMPFVYVGDVEITVGDRNILREGGETVIDVPSTPETDPIFYRLIFALRNEEALARRAKELVLQGVNPLFKRPPTKSDVIRNAIAKNAALRSSMSESDFKKHIHGVACEDLRELSTKKPEIADLWKPGNDPVTLKQVANVLNPKPAEHDDEPLAVPVIGAKFSIRVRPKLVFRPPQPHPKRKRK